jgi:CubicO group peptidase (beta-lactamase class C family)
MMPTNADQRLPRTAPEQQGIPSSAVLQFVEALEGQVHELHSFMLLRHGSVVAEGWWSPYKADLPHLMFSVSKSFTSTAVGLAVAEGRFSLDDLVLSFFPEQAPAEVSDFLAAITVRHLLTMSTGQVTDTWSDMVLRLDGNWIAGFFEVPVVYAPGTHFLYNTGATYMLSAIVQKTTGMKVLDYLQPRLFEPLGIENATWADSPQGITAGGIGLSLKTEDLARFGQLYLQKGQWQGQQLIEEAWVTAATSSQISNGSDEERDWTQGYGYQFWRSRHGAYRADGVFGQLCIVMPDQDAVLAITGGMDVFDMQQPLDLLWKLLPAMDPDPLPEDQAAETTLVNKLSTLALPLAQGQTKSTIASQVSGQTYLVDANSLKVETITPTFTASGCTLTLKTAGGEETIRCGYGAWLPGETTLFGQPLLFDRAIVAASGGWTAEETFTMIARLVETPFFHKVVFHFMGEDMMVESGVNVSLESLEPILLTARAVQKIQL